LESKAGDKGYALELGQGLAVQQPASREEVDADEPPVHGQEPTGREFECSAGLGMHVLFTGRIRSEAQ